MTGFCVVVACVVVIVVVVARKVERRVVVKACLVVVKAFLVVVKACLVVVVVVVIFGAIDVVSTPVSPLHKSVVQVQAKVISSMVTGSHEAEGRMGSSALPSSRESGLKHSLTVE